MTQAIRPRGLRERMGRGRPAAGGSAEDAVPDRPRLLPRGRWTRWALLALILFTLFRGVLWGVTTPAFWGPDEDYHFFYAQYLTTQHALIDPEKPLYPGEYHRVEVVSQYNAYYPGPRENFDGDAKASVKSTSGLPKKAREPRDFGRGIGVVHPPLYQGLAAGINWTLGDASALTRMTWIRFMTALFGALAVLFTWVLAAQFIRSAPAQLLCALLVATQPMLGFLSGIVNHDAALIAFFTAALAMMAFMARTPPRARQGAWLGLAVLLALLVKGSALVLVPLAALTYLAQGFVYRDRWREVAKSAALAAAPVLLIAGAWYIRARIEYGSTAGATNDVLPSGAANPGDLGDLFTYAREWTGYVYGTYWWHYNPDFVLEKNFVRFLPGFIGALGALGLVVLGWKHWRAFLRPDNPVLRQVVLMVLAALSLYALFMGVDVLRRLDGGHFLVVGGRYLLPAYPAVAVLLVVGLRALLTREAQRIVLPVLGAVSVAFCIDAYIRFYAHRYFGEVDLGEYLRRLSFDRPAFVTSTTLTLLLVLIALSLAGFAYATVRATRTPVDG